MKSFDIATKNNMLLGIEASRGWAALLVVFTHVNGFISSQDYFNTIAFYNYFSFGSAGVDFFFRFEWIYYFL